MSQNLSERLSKELAEGKEPTPPPAPKPAPAAPAGSVHAPAPAQMPKGIIPLLEYHAPTMEELIPKDSGITPKLLIDQLVYRMKSNPAIAGCTDESIKNAIKNCALLGLQPGYGGNTAEAYLIPYKKELNLEISYKGFETIVMRSGRYKQIKANALFDEDIFQHWDENGETRFRYTPCGSQQTLTGAFAYAEDYDGNLHVVFMTSDAIDALEKKSRKSASMTKAWKDWPDRMYRKTVMRRLCNELPKTPAIPLLERLAAIDVAAEPRSVKQLSEGLE
jgi:recombination protein RecT